MIYEAEVTFNVVKPLVFLRDKDAKQIEQGTKYNLFVLPDRNKIVFLSN
jgi:hypothetical protein